MTYVIPILLITVTAIAAFMTLKKKPPSTAADPYTAYIQSEADAPSLVLNEANVETYLVWKEPNRAATPPLHIGQSGERYSTLTGVSWLDANTCIIAHRSGLMLAIFDVNDPRQPLLKSRIDHLSDDVVAKETGKESWEIAVSGCWDCAYSLYKLTRENGNQNGFAIELVNTRAHNERTFSHGVAYDAEGRLCVSMSTGERPRIEIGSEVHELPKPWGARDVIYDDAKRRHLAVAVSADPKRSAYDKVKTSIWTKGLGEKEWKILSVYDNVHSDAICSGDGRIWIPDQLGNRLFAVNGATGAIEAIFSGDCFNFPHGLDVSADGKLAITNYGSSIVAIVDPKLLFNELKGVGEGRA